MKNNITFKKLLEFRNKTYKDKIIILATGVFDTLHIEHIRFLKKAKAQGDILLVGVESDVRVKSLKGKGRPINKQNIRLKKIVALDMVDYVFILPNNLGNKEGREDFIKKLRPNLYAVSANTPFIKEKQRIMQKFGGKLKVVHTHNPTISTTIISSNPKNK